MIDLFTRLLPLLLLDAVNPVLFAQVLTTLGSHRPLGYSMALLAGHTIAYFCVGLIAALGLDQITERLLNPQPVDYIVSTAVGLLCLWAALKSRGGGASEERQPDEQLTPLRCFTFGAIVNFLGAPFAVPYLAAVDQILRADLSIQASLLALLAYNLAFALPFALMPVLRIIVGEACMPWLRKINAVLVTVADTAMPILLLLLGLGLLVDAGLFFWTGTGLV